uniref:Secreted protein n=1 Tax=Rhipicephalus appendiculatus TaxID=34631 RepID=A0A131YB52_RHIAP
MFDLLCSVYLFLTTAALGSTSNKRESDRWRRRLCEPCKKSQNERSAEFIHRLKRSSLLPWSGLGQMNKVPVSVERCCFCDSHDTFFFFCSLKTFPKCPGFKEHKPNTVKPR